MGKGFEYSIKISDLLSAIEEINQESEQVCQQTEKYNWGKQILSNFNCRFGSSVILK